MRKRTLTTVLVIAFLAIAGLLHLAREQIARELPPKVKLFVIAQCKNLLLAPNTPNHELGGDLRSTIERGCNDVKIQSVKAAIGFFVGSVARVEMDIRSSYNGTFHPGAVMHFYIRYSFETSSWEVIQETQPSRYTWACFS